MAWEWTANVTHFNDNEITDEFLQLEMKEADPHTLYYAAEFDPHTLTNGSIKMK